MEEEGDSPFPRRLVLFAWQRPIRILQEFGAETTAKAARLVSALPI